MRADTAATLGASLAMAARIFSSRAVIPSTNFPPPTFAAAFLMASSVRVDTALAHRSSVMAFCMLLFHLPAAAFMAAVGERRGLAGPVSQSPAAVFTRGIILGPQVSAVARP